jgi:predicted ArsR family transcriptional regulator
MNKNGTRAIIEAALKVYAPVTAPQLAEHIGLSQQGILWHLKTLHDATPKLAYIVAYQPQTEKGRDVCVWAYGDCKDAEHSAKRHSPVDRQQTIVLPLIEPNEQLEDQEDRRITQAEARQRRKLLDGIKPFRDPMLFVTAGVSP